MKAVFQANDGEIFETEKECKDYEEFKKSKPRIIIDWLIANIANDIENTTLDDFEEEEDEKEDYLGIIEALKCLGEQEEIEKIIGLNEEILSLLFRWSETEKEEFSAAILAINLLKDRESKDIEVLRRALEILVKAYSATRFEQGSLRLPNASNPWSGADFTSSILYGELCDDSRKSSYEKELDTSNELYSLLKKREICLTCRHWDTEDEEQHTSPFTARGKCTRLPPSEGEFPSTIAIDRCGEWNGR